MWKQFASRVRLNWADIVGFACFLGFVYCSLFGCGLSTADGSSVGLPTTYSLERIWAWSGVAEASGAALGLIAARAFRLGDTCACCRRSSIAALIMAIAGAILIWLAWLAYHSPAFGVLHIAGGGCAGLAVAFFTVSWGKRIATFDEARIEFVIPAAFPLLFVIYLLLLFFKFSSLLNLGIVILLCIGSFACVMRRADAGQTQTCMEARRHCAGGSSWKNLLSFGALVCASWIQVAYFRVISTPALSGNRYTHYLYPFLMACVVSWVMLLLCIYISRNLNITLAFRWSLPLFVLAYVPLLIDYDDRMLRMMGYAINFLGMFGVQFGCWLGACKFARRTHHSAADVFGFYAFGEGLGIALGCCVGLWAMYDLDASYLTVLSFALLALVQFVLMFTGFNPNWVFRRAVRTKQEEGAVQGDGSLPSSAAATNALDAADAMAAVSAGIKATPTMDDLCRQAALELQATYVLSERETEVAALLLTGRSRPFIRDELFISLNTVGVHVRKVYGKCGVHSQQELIDLARGSERA